MSSPVQAKILLNKPIIIEVCRSIPRNHRPVYKSRLTRVSTKKRQNEQGYGLLSTKPGGMVGPEGLEPPAKAL